MSDSHDFAADKAGALFDVAGLGVVVTGAASGIGLAYAQVLAANGARVVMADVDLGGARTAAQEITGAGFEAYAEALDITDSDAVDRVLNAAAERFGKLDVVFANAGVNRGYSLRYADGEIDKFPEKTWHEVLDINLFGTISTIRSAAGIMKAQGSGSIIVTASISGMTPDPMVGYPYMTSKTAIIGIVRQVSIELAPYGVRINAIAPGSVRTNIAKGRPKPKDYATAWEDTIPMGRFGMPDELKGIALLLASPASSFATGSAWEIDGGGASLTKGRMSDVGPIRAETPTGNA